MKTKPNAFHFFLRHAGYSYDPKTETPLQGRRRCAKLLANAEREAAIAGYYFRWEHDGFTNREWEDSGEEYATWGCVMFDANGVSLQSLCGIDFGNGGEPWGDPYRRVIEAELACEEL